MSTTQQPPRTASRLPVTAAVRIAALLIGLPLLLHVVWALTPTRLGVWPAVVVTLGMGIGLSVVFTRPRCSSVVDPESLVEDAQGFGRPPVPLPEDRHRGGDEQHADQGRVGGHHDRQRDADLLDGLHLS